MKSLLIDTSLNRIIVAATVNNTILFVYNEECHRDFSAQVMKVIEEQFSKHNLTINEIDNLFVVVGPGSFTGIRIGLTIAKVIGWSLKKKIIPLSSLELLATTVTDADIIIPYIDARRDCMYAGIYNCDLKIIMPDTYISREELLKNIPNGLKCTCVSYDSLITTIPTIIPNIDILRIIDLHKEDAGIDAHLVKPNYLKLTEAEVNKNANN